MANKVTIYHGTTALAADSIWLSGLGEPAGKVYVTTDRERAVQYARAWTAWAMTVRLKKGEAVEPVGLLAVAEVDKRKLTRDDYNPDDEPDQYVTKPLPYDKLARLERVTFDDLRDDTVRLREYCYWIGVTRQREDRILPTLD